jgi:aspartyl-tRNA(Asn)/glutamyl-tRNA(Gln) amidotransferase subunit C
MAIDREQLLHVAHLARLELREDEVERLGVQLNDIIEAVSKVSELDLWTCRRPGKARRRERLEADEPRPSLPLDDALTNAPSATGPRSKSPGT